MSELQRARDAVAELMAFSRDPRLQGFRRFSLGCAVAAAETAELVGEEYDTRMLSGVLTEALAQADEEQHQEGVRLYAGKLLAVLSDLADGGDEEAAEGVNACAATLPAELVRYGAACAAKRRSERNGQ